MITKDTTVVNDTDVDRGIPNASWGLIKDHTLQLRDGYLNRTPFFQFILLSICFPMWGMAVSMNDILITQFKACLLYTSPSPRDATLSRMPSSA